MTYSKYFLPQTKRIPLALTVAVIIVLLMLLARGLAPDSLKLKAGKKSLKNLQIMQLSHNQAAVFWQTEIPEIGWIIYGSDEKNLKQTALDERDFAKKRSGYKNHLVWLKNLNSNTRYFYKIVAANQLVEKAPGSAFSFLTPADLRISSSLDPAYGKIISDNGLGVLQAIVILKFKNAFPSVTLTKTTGEWLIPLTYLIDMSTLKQVSIAPTDRATILVLNESDKRSKIEATYDNINPLPQTVILGKNYNFVKNGEILAAKSDGEKVNLKPDILFPKEGAVIPGGKPLIKGTALPQNRVKINIDGKEGQTFEISTDKDGIWNLLLDNNLSIGNHRLEVEIRDESGKLVKLVRLFTIAKSGEQVLGEATPEGSPTLTPTEISETPTVLTPTKPPIITSYPSLTPTPPTSGGNIIPFSAASASLVIIGLGILLAF